MPEGPSARRDAASRLREAGKGALLDELRLNGEVDLGEGRSSSASLCLASTGLYLVLLRGDTTRAEAGVLDLFEAGRRVGYRSQLLGDRLDVDDWVLSIPWRRSEHALRILGLARIRRAFGLDRRDREVAPRGFDDSEGPWAWVEPFVSEPGPLGRAWLASWLDADEHLLVWRPTESRHRFSSELLGPTDAAIILVVTERRQSLVAISAAGDLWSEAVPERGLELVSSAVGRATLRAGDRELSVGLGEDKTFAELAPLPGLAELDRLRAMARLLWLRGRGPGGASFDRAAAILDELAGRDPFARLARALLVDPRGGPFAMRALAAAAAEHGDGDGDAGFAETETETETEARVVARAPLETLPDPVLAALRELIDTATPTTAQALVDWWKIWELGPELGEVLVEHLCELGRGGLELALPLHEELRPLLLAKLADDPADAALLDFVFAEHLLALGRSEQALELLAARRRLLPSEQLQDLLPPSAARGGQQIRIELYELAAAAHAQLGDGHVFALTELARLQPLVVERVEQLVEGLEAQAGQGGGAGDGAGEGDAEGDGPGGLLVRARAVLGLLDEDGFAGRLALTAAKGALVLGTEDPLDAEGGELARRRVRALDEAELELLRHPAARADGALGRLQGALAKVAVPDCSILKSYCERANLAHNQALARALTDATVILGLGGVEVFISRGDKSVGLRAYEGPTSFLLIGGDHCNPRSDAYLDEGPLRFAVTAELAHLRYAHCRVTNNEVWAGTVDLGLTGLGMLIAAAPILKGLKAPAKHLLDKVGAPAIDRLRRKLVRSDAHTLASDNSQVIAAHRVMQLSADRAGLLACGDPDAAIRAMFAVHPAYLSLWPMVASHGLRAALTRELRADDERHRLEDLAVRVAALLSFYMSDEYAKLRATVLGC